MMEDRLEKAILVSIRDEEGRIQNIIDHAQFVAHADKFGMMPDVYFCFVLKTLVDDFGTFVVKGTQGKVNQEQFEASLIDNLREMLSDKTRL